MPEACISIWNLELGTRSKKPIQIADFHRFPLYQIICKSQIQISFTPSAEYNVLVLEYFT
jgi:hypothetical protein